MPKDNKVENRLNLTYYGGADVYSDGEVEDTLLDIAKSNTEKQLNQMIADTCDWSILYHFSHIRQNIVSWLPIKDTDTVLEIGSGCGAITGALAKKAGKVTCVDLSKKRSLVNVYRNDSYDNIEVMVGNFKDVEPNLPQFDYVTLIGVFEYGEAYIGGDTPYEDFLRIIKSHIRPGGKLVIAIENRWGMKYFAGCREDHFGTFFEGINGYPVGKGVKTFTRMELETMFDACGFLKRTFYYPYPDYKLPLSIYSDDFLPQAGSLNNNFRNFDEDRMLVFDESKVFDNLLSDGMFDIFSNSFLVIAGKGEKA